MKNVFLPLILLSALPVFAENLPPLETTPVAPMLLERRGAYYFADFGKAAYGNLQIKFANDVPAADLTIRLGEKLADGQIDRKPPGSVSYREVKLSLQPGTRLYQLQIPTKERHKNPAAVHTPPEIGEIAPFRYAEIENCPVELSKDNLRQLWVHAPFNDNAASFECDDTVLTAVWNLCKHTMKSTTAFGVYIDGERERIPYEADAYINQLSHYAVDLDPRVARYTVGHLLAHPTWPTEWSLHMPMMAYADYQATGDAVLARQHYEALKKKLLMDKAREDGLIKAGAIVDWPTGERDGYNAGKADPNQKQQVGPEINTVANAFYYHALQSMETLARATGKDDEAHQFALKAQTVYGAFNQVFFNEASGLYTDGEGSNHSSLHANMFALAFDLVPEAKKDKVAAFVAGKGMECSVYGAQYLLEALFKAGRDRDALQLLTARHDRSWWHMMELGSTMTLEAWDGKYKPNLTWNHAWGSAPANIISRYVLGVRPLSPGYEKILIAPQAGTLHSVRGQVPTAKGSVNISYFKGATGKIEFTIPAGTSARLEWPRGNAKKALFDGANLTLADGATAIIVDDVKSGQHVLATE